MELETFHFHDNEAWRDWLIENHDQENGVYLIFYKIAHPKPSMRWEEAVREALCFGWIDSTVKSLGNGKRRQYFCPRTSGSAWSKLNKAHISDLRAEGKLHSSGLQCIEAAKADGSWNALDDVENGIIPEDLQHAMDRIPKAKRFYDQISWTHQKSYLYWLHQAKRDATRQKRIQTIVKLLEAGKKNRYG